jgi:hypothetical protein
MHRRLSETVIVCAVVLWQVLSATPLRAADLPLGEGDACSNVAWNYLILEPSQATPGTELLIRGSTRGQAPHVEYYWDADTNGEVSGPDLYLAPAVSVAGESQASITVLPSWAGRQVVILGVARPSNGMGVLTFAVLDVGACSAIGWNYFYVVGRGSGQILLRGSTWGDVRPLEFYQDINENGYWDEWDLHLGTGTTVEGESQLSIPERPPCENGPARYLSVGTSTDGNCAIATLGMDSPPAAVDQPPPGGRSRDLLLRVGPNPFNPRTLLEFELPMMETVSLSVVDVRGRHVRQVLREMRDPGRHRIVFDGLDDRGQRLASGVYTIVLETPSGSVTDKIALIR